MDENTAISGNTAILGCTDPEDEKLLVRIQILLLFKKFIYNRMCDTQGLRMPFFLQKILFYIKLWASHI